MIGNFATKSNVGAERALAFTDELSIIVNLAAMRENNTNPPNHKYLISDMNHNNILLIDELIHC